MYKLKALSGKSYTLSPFFITRTGARFRNIFHIRSLSCYYVESGGIQAPDDKRDDVGAANTRETRCIWRKDGVPYDIQMGKKTRPDLH